MLDQRPTAVFLVGLPGLDRLEKHPKEPNQEEATEDHDPGGEKAQRNTEKGRASAPQGLHVLRLQRQWR